MQSVDQRSCFQLPTRAHTQKEKVRRREEEGKKKCKRQGTPLLFDINTEVALKVLFSEYPTVF